MALVQPKNFAEVKEGSFDIYCKKLGKKITVKKETMTCPECGAQLVNMGFALVE